MAQMGTRANTKVFFIDLKEATKKGKDARWRWWDMYPKLGSESGPNPEHVEILREALSESGPAYWNDWRRAHPSEQPQLSGIEFPTHAGGGKPVGIRLEGLDFSEADMHGVQLHFARLHGLRMDKANLRESLIMQAHVSECTFAGADLTQICLGSTNISECDLNNADMLRAILMNVHVDHSSFASALLENADLSNSQFIRCDFESSRLSCATCENSEFSACNLTGANLQRVSMVKTKFTTCDFSHSNVYGINAWDVELSGDTVQLDLVVTEETDHGEVKVDDLRVAQFIHLILTNSRISQVIEAIGGKGILILGRFTENRKSLLESLRTELRTRGFIPILFDFKAPPQRDITEMVVTLAGFSLFVIADITGPRSVPLELEATVPKLMIPFVPLIQEGEEPFSMIQDLRNKYDWVLDPLVYDTPENLMKALDAGIIEPALKLHEVLVGRKARSIGTRHVREFAARQGG